MKLSRNSPQVSCGVLKSTDWVPERREEGKSHGFGIIIMTPQVLPLASMQGLPFLFRVVMLALPVLFLGERQAQ